MSRVLIIGGGLAGITAALDCADAGAEVTLLESRGRLGGAAYTFERDGLRVDNGQHVFLRCCEQYLGLVARLGAAGSLMLAPRLSVPVLAPGGQVGWLQREDLPAPLHLARSLLAYPFLSHSERISLGLAMARLSRLNPDDPSVDARSFGDWLAAQHQSANAIEVIWELIAKPTLNLGVADASLAQAAYVFQQGLLADRAAGDIGYSAGPLGDIHDVAARAALQRAGVTVRLRCGAVAIERGTEGAFSVEVGGPGAGPPESANGVVVALGPTRAGTLLPAAAGVDLSDLDALGSSPIVNLHVVYDRPVMGVDFAATVHSPVQWIFDRTRASGLERGQYLAISLSAADGELSMTAEALAERFLPAIEAVLPSAAAARMERFFVTREHAATFRAAPGQRALRPGARTAMDGLVLAGAWTDTGWPATMEGAVRSGHAAAAALLPRLSRTPEPALAAA